MYARVVAEELEELSDASLIRRFKLGDQEALGVLLRRHSDSLYRFCLYLVTNREDAEDVYQETLARAISRVDTLETGTAFRSWLFRIARNLSVDAFRNRKRTLPLLDEDVAPIPTQEDGPEERVEVVEEHRTVAEALSQLAQSHQRVLVLREVEGLSYAAIAQELDVSQSAVETLLFRARRRLREEYSKRAATISGLAVMSSVRELATKVAGPLLAGPPVATKVAVGAAVVGGTMAWTQHMYPRVSPTLMAARHVASAHPAIRPRVNAPVSTHTARPSRHRSSSAAPRVAQRVLPARTARHAHHKTQQHRRGNDTELAAVYHQRHLRHAAQGRHLRLHDRRRNGRPQARLRRAHRTVVAARAGAIQGRTTAESAVIRVNHPSTGSAPEPVAAPENPAGVPDGAASTLPAASSIVAGQEPPARSTGGSGPASRGEPVSVAHAPAAVPVPVSAPGSGTDGSPPQPSFPPATPAPSSRASQGPAPIDAGQIRPGTSRSAPSELIAPADASAAYRTLETPTTSSRSTVVTVAAGAPPNTSPERRP